MDGAAVPLKPKEHTWLPLLTVLFLGSYALMALLVVEQGQTIQSQRYLIKELFHDSSALSTMKNQAIQKQRADAQAQAKAQARHQSQPPSTQVQPREGAHDGSAKRARRPAPQKPPTRASDNVDERRIVISI